MKQCPACKLTFQDDSLSFCLNDGTTLITNSGAQVTEQFPSHTNPARVNIPIGQETVVSRPAQTDNQPVPVKPGVNPLMVVLVLGMLLLMGVVAAVVVYIAFGNRDAGMKAANESPPPAAANSQTNTQSETDKLKDEIEKLRKQIEDQNKSNKTGTTTVPKTGSSTPAPVDSTVRTATVNSPGDGFLAMRTLPNSETGERVMKIPTGATVAVGGCLPPAKGKTGRWCRVAYGGQTGWAFDAYLIY